MNLTTTTICPECGVILDAPDDVERVTCTDCHSVLRLRRGSTHTEAVVVTGREGLDAVLAGAHGPLTADERAQALAELEVAWQAERERLSQPGLRVLGRIVTRRAPNVWSASGWIAVGLVLVVTHTLRAGRGTIGPMWLLSGTATMAVCLYLAYVEFRAAAELARARRRYEAVRAAIIAGQPVDLRELARLDST